MAFKKTVLALGLMAVASGVGATNQPSTTLKVQGKLVPSACKVSLENGGVVTFESRVISELSPTGTNYIGSKTIKLQIDC
ncbi:MAG: DUF1120 domain-containing protein [Enterobacteriaceae bacterium]